MNRVIKRFYCISIFQLTADYIPNAILTLQKYSCIHFPTSTGNQLFQTLQVSRPVAKHFSSEILVVQGNSSHSEPLLTKRMDVLLQDLVKSRDLVLNFSNHSEIRQAPWQQCCQDACQISEWYDHYNIQSRGFRDLTKFGGKTSCRLMDKGLKRTRLVLHTIPQPPKWPQVSPKQAKQLPKTASTWNIGRLL